MTEEASIAPLALKGQKLLAQGNTLGIMAISTSPCKGKSFILPFYSFTFKKKAKNILNFQITLLPLKNRQKIFLIFK